jgi:uncharacterized damage-inducible protein DinB
MANKDCARLSIERLIELYAAGSTELAEVLFGLRAEQLHTRVAPGKWSILEVLCHIADSELIYAESFRRVLVEDSPTLFNLEPDDFERGLLYDKRDPHEEIALINTIRSQTARILRNIPDGDWERRGIHSTDGALTLRQLIERVTSHIPHHVEFIKGKVRSLATRK